MNKQTPPPEFQGAILSQGIKDKIEEDKDWQSMLLIGPPGTGKTHAIWALQQAKGHNAYILNEGIDIDGARNEYGKIHSDTIDEWANFPHCLCIDDIGYGDPDTMNKHVIYKIAIIRRQKGLQTVWTTNLARDVIAQKYSDAIASRVLGGLVIETKSGDRRQN